MIVVIIAGGSGTRLWPLSTPDYPKHLLTVDGSDASLLQSTYERARQLSEHIYIVSDDSHIEHVRQQLPNLPADNFIVEPARRGTASCILAALLHVSHHHDADEPIAIMASEHYIRDVQGFLHSFHVAGGASHQEGRIVLIGIEPNYPATGFGYIQKDGVLDEKTFIFNVDSFKEKPDHDTAVRYLNSGNYLWNSGYFVGSINTFTREMQAAAPQLFSEYQRLREATAETYNDVYLGFETISIDYALIEKVTDLLVVPASFDWMDLGSFADLHRAVDSDKQGNHVSGKVELEDVQNTIVQNHEDKPVAVIGLENVAVINTPHGLLVTRKDASQKVGDVSKRLLNRD
jgi:mannose-1-phosphate guanylyltransferase/mannose-6-phosphate isomerase